MAEINPINKETEDLIINPVSGDSYVLLQIGSVDKYVIGVDDDDADALKINQGGATPSAGTNIWKMTAAGERTMPLQPSFLGNLSATDANVTGDSTQHTLGSGNNLTEIWDSGADLNNATGVFTAPATGRYFLHGNMLLSGLAAANVGLRTVFVGSNRSQLSSIGNIGIIRDAGNTVSIENSFLLDMDAADTAYFTVIVSNGAKVVSVTASATNTYSCFSGNLSE